MINDDYDVSIIWKKSELCAIRPHCLNFVFQEVIKNLVQLCQLNWCNPLFHLSELLCGLFFELHIRIIQTQIIQGATSMCNWYFALKVFRFLENGGFQFALPRSGGYINCISWNSFLLTQCFLVLIF